MALQVSLRDPGAGAGLRVRLAGGSVVVVPPSPVVFTLAVGTAEPVALAVSTAQPLTLGTSTTTTDSDRVLSLEITA